MNFFVVCEFVQGATEIVCLCQFNNSTSQKCMLKYRDIQQIYSINISYIFVRITEIKCVITVKHEYLKQNGCEINLYYQCYFQSQKTD